MSDPQVKSVKIPGVQVFDLDQANGAVTRLAASISIMH
jgi:hypothetical protein